LIRFDTNAMVQLFLSINLVTKKSKDNY